MEHLPNEVRLLYRRQIAPYRYELTRILHFLDVPKPKRLLWPVPGFVVLAKVRQGIQVLPFSVLRLFQAGSAGPAPGKRYKYGFLSSFRNH